MISTMSTSEKPSIHGNILYFNPPETLADFRLDMIGNAHFKNESRARLYAMHLLNIFIEDDAITDDTKKMTAYWLDHYPEFKEEVRQARPELLEM